MRILGPRAIYYGLKRRAIRYLNDAATYRHYRKADYRNLKASDIDAISSSAGLLSTRNPHLRNAKITEYLDKVQETIASNDIALEEHQLISDSLVVGHVTVYGKLLRFDVTPDWNVDVTDGGSWPKLFFTRYKNRINGQSAKHGDYRHTWELNRTQHLLGLSLMYGLSSDRRYLQCLTNHIVTWVEQNPPFWSLNWMSSMELGLRMVTWCLVLTRIDEKDIEEETRSLILVSIYQQMRFLNENLSVEFGDAGSDTVLKNNHTILELCCLMIVATCLPPIAESVGLSRDKSKKLMDYLLVELERQTSIDGMQVEQASSYLRFVLEALLLTRLIVPETAALDVYINGYMSALNAFRYGETVIFVVGDEDNGHVLLPNYTARPDSIREVLEMYDVLYREAIHNSVSPSQMTGWDSKKNASSILNDSGHWLCRIASRELDFSLYFRAGRLDFPTIPGYSPHAHCDLLSLNLAIGEHLWLVDRGTFTYHNRAIQDELRRSAAHNTVIVDGFEQMRLLGPFHSDSHAPCQMLNAESRQVEGVMTLQADGHCVELARAISVDAESCRISVHDSIRGLRGECVQWVLNLHPAVVMSGTGLLSREDSDFCIQLVGWEEAERHTVVYSPKIWSCRRRAAIKTDDTTR